MATLSKIACFSLLSALLVSTAPAQEAQPEIVNRSKALVTVDGLQFHDRSGNNSLDLYEDWRLSPEERAADLLSRMTLREKAGLMMHGTPPTADGSWDVESMRASIEDDQIHFFLHRIRSDIEEMAQLANDVQEIAEATRLGIPIVFSSDSRNTIREVLGVSVAPAGFTLWPEALGLAAIGDADLVRELSKIAAREYRAIGISMALSPQADLATEPRWFRGNATFGDTPERVSPMVKAFVEGFQGGKDGVRPGHVATVVKHWAGYGSQVKGYDAHNPYGKYMSVTEDSVEAHFAAFQGALEADVAGVMPTYSLPAEDMTLNGEPVEPVAIGFNKQMLDGQLRERFGFDGVVLSDWLITADCLEECLAGTHDLSELGMPWGVEDLTVPERFAKGIEAGIDQFGGAMETDVVEGIVKEGLVSEERLDRSVMRLLTLMFRLGLFENAYVDVGAVRAQVGAPEARALGLEAQHRSMVLLENKDNFLPLTESAGTKVWLWNADEDAAREAGLDPVDSPAVADFALLRIDTPFETRPEFFFGSSAHEGPLTVEPGSESYQAIARAEAAGIPVVVDVYLDRPAVLTNIQPMVTAMIGQFGVTDAALFDIVTGNAEPEGRLPVELPSSDREVEAQRSDLPSDTANPLYPRDYGLSYE